MNYHEHRSIWYTKPIIRRIYREWYWMVRFWLVPGRTVELGSGIGNFKGFRPSTISTEIVPLRWVNAVANAEDLPFKHSTISNLVMIDVLHHVNRRWRVFDEANRVLRTGGRVILIEPYMSLVSWWFYYYFHPEPVNMRHDPFVIPMETNQAVASILFERSLLRFTRFYPRLTVKYRRRFAFLAYPLSGGFSHRSLLPMWLLRPVLWLERHMTWLGRLCAFRILIVLEKT